jgi:6-pyruvoyl-tetrahydropterin synthase
MVVDFGILKRAFQPILDEWDHALLLPRVIADRYRDEVTLKKVVSLDWNPTAEQIAEEIAGRVELTLARRHDPERRRKVWLAWVRVWETVTSSATCILEMPP